jgi:hypothetical protein
MSVVKQTGGESREVYSRLVSQYMDYDTAILSLLNNQEIVIGLATHLYCSSSEGCEVCTIEDTFLNSLH